MKALISAVPHLTRANRLEYHPRMNFISKEWSNVVTVSCIAVAGIIEAYQQAISGAPAASVLPALGGWWHYVPLALLTLGGIAWLIGSSKKEKQEGNTLASKQPSQAVGIPSLSSLLGKEPTISFDSKYFFLNAYYSPLTVEVENNIKTIAQQSRPDDRESFLANFIGIGLVAFIHEGTWMSIYRSQILALMELNRRAGPAPIGVVKAFYDKGASDFHGFTRIIPSING